MARYSILVADDDPGCREVIAETLVRAGHRPLTASCGLEAIDLVERRAGKIHATILDMHMPDLTGLETLEAIFRRVDRLPAIFVTADRSRELRAKAMEAGAHALLNKPVKTKLMLLTLGQLLGKFYGGAIKETD